MWIATSAHAKEMDRRASEEFRIPIATLMASAGQAVFDAIPPTAHRIAFACGKGKNGGDGFVAARLAALAGHEVVCFAPADGELGGHALRERLALGSIPVRPWDSADFSSFDLIVDAILGTGARAPLSAPMEALIRAIAASNKPVLSVDVPSGIDVDTGAPLGAHVTADQTVCLAQPKPFLFQGEGSRASGKWTVAPIGFPPELLNAPTDARFVSISDAGSAMPRRVADSHKGSHGHVLIVAGCDRMPGAAILAALGALRAGSGRVTLASTPRVCDAMTHHAPEVMVWPLGLLEAKAILADQDRFSALVVGPGLGREPATAALVAELWEQWSGPAIFDADALHVIPPKAREAVTVLTPHPGELAQMLGTTATEIQASRWATARRAAEEFGATVLLKGQYSVTATIGQPLAVNSTGNPGMATGGMGDVLAGIVGALLAASLTPHEAAWLAALWHGAAADASAKEIGSAGYTASEVSARLPGLRDKMTASCKEE